MAARASRDPKTVSKAKAAARASAGRGPGTCGAEIEPRVLKALQGLCTSKQLGEDLTTSNDVLLALAGMDTLDALAGIKRLGSYQNWASVKDPACFVSEQLRHMPKADTQSAAAASAARIPLAASAPPPRRPPDVTVPGSEGAAAPAHLGGPAGTAAPAPARRRLPFQGGQLVSPLAGSEGDSIAVSISSSMAASQPFKTAAEAREAAGFSGEARGDPGVVAALRDLCRAKSLNPDVAKSADLRLVLAGMPPETALAGIKRLQGCHVDKWAAIQNPAGYIITVLRERERVVRGPGKHRATVAPSTLAPPEAQFGGQAAAAQLPEGVTAEVWDYMMQLCAVHGMEWADLEQKVLPELRSAPPEAASRAIAGLTASFWDTRVYSPANLIAARIRKEAEGKLRSNCGGGAASSSCASDAGGSDGFAGPELAPAVEAALAALCTSCGAERHMLRDRLLWQLSDTEPAAAVAMLRGIYIKGSARNPVAVLAVKIRNALDALAAEHALAHSPQAATSLDDSPQAAAALELHPDVWRAFAALCTEQGLPWEGLRPEVLTPLQALTADVALHAILQLHTRKLGGVMSASRDIKAILLKQRSVEEDRERRLSELHPAVAAALESMCRVRGLPMHLLMPSAFFFLESWPPEQAAAALQDLESPLSEHIADPTAFLLDTLEPMLSRDWERGRGSRPPYDSASARQPHPSADAAPVTRAQAHTAPPAVQRLSGVQPPLHASSPLRPSSAASGARPLPQSAEPPAPPQYRALHEEVDMQPSPPQDLAGICDKFSSERCPSPVGPPAPAPGPGPPDGRPRQTDRASVDAPEGDLGGGLGRGAGGEEAPPAAAAAGVRVSCLAATVRCLWQCEAFQEALSELRVSEAAGDAERRAARGLHSALASVAHSCSGEALVAALAEVAAVKTESLARLGAVREPSEALYWLLDMISAAVQPGGLEADPDPATGVVALPVHYFYACSACGTRSHEVDFMQLVHNVFACDLRRAAAAEGGLQEGAAQLGRLLRTAGQKYTSPCRATGPGGKGCKGKGTPVVRPQQGAQPPPVFAIAVAWDSPHEAPPDQSSVRGTLRALPPALDLGELYPSGPPCCYQLRSMSLKECGSGGAGAAWRAAAGCWRLLRSGQEREVGSWRQLCDCCTSDGLLPELLFFEAPQG